MRRNSFYSVLSVFLAGIVGFGACVLGFVSRDDNGKWFKNSNLSKWHWADVPVEKPKDNTDDKKDEAHLHTYDLTKWGFNAEEHFRQASCGHEEVIGRGKHDYAKIAGKDTCTVCGYEKGTISTSDFVIEQTDEDDGIALTSLEYKSGDFADMGFPSNTISAYRVAATVKDATGSTVGISQAVDYSLSWLDWHNAEEYRGSMCAGENVVPLNVDSKVKVIKVNDNTADIVCVGSFDCPIELTVTVHGTEISKTVRLDFVRKLNFLNAYFSNITNYKLPFGSFDYNLEVWSNNSGFEKIGGTLFGEFFTFGVKFIFTKEFINALTTSPYWLELKRIMAIPTDGFRTVNLPTDVNVQSSYMSDQNLNIRAIIGDNGFTKILTDKIKFFDHYLLYSFMSDSDANEVFSRSNIYLNYAIIDAAKKVSSAVQFEIYYTYSYKNKIFVNRNTNSGPPSSLDTTLLGGVPQPSSVELDGADFAF